MTFIVNINGKPVQGVRKCLLVFALLLFVVPLLGLLFLLMMPLLGMMLATMLAMVLLLISIAFYIARRYTLINKTPHADKIN